MNSTIHHGSQTGPVLPVPLKELGRFYREAVAVDRRTGIVYQTEDRIDGLIYRFIPNIPGALRAGGRLQALTVLGTKALDTRNFAETGAPRVPVGEPMSVQWIDLDHVDSPDDDLRMRGAERGAAVFARGEGMWYGNGEVYFACTSRAPMKAPLERMLRPGSFSSGRSRRPSAGLSPRGGASRTEAAIIEEYGTRAH